MTVEKDIPPHRLKPRPTTTIAAKSAGKEVTAATDAMPPAAMTTPI
jgi:hypothetical protein